jgi:hypothetical protein
VILPSPAGPVLMLAGAYSAGLFWCALQGGVGYLLFKFLFKSDKNNYLFKIIRATEI